MRCCGGCRASRCTRSHLEPGPKGFTYPPFAAVLLVPLTWLPAGPAAILVLLASAVVVVLVTWWLVAPVARRHEVSPWFAVALAVPVVLALEPIRQTLGEGQLNMFIFALVLADVVALRRGRAWAGVGIGLGDRTETDARRCSSSSSC